MDAKIVINLIICDTIIKSNAFATLRSGNVKLGSLIFWMVYLAKYFHSSECGQGDVYIKRLSLFH